MDINELKEMLRHSTAVLIMDNGQPSYVVLDYANYKKMLEQSEANGLASSSNPARSTQSSESELLERINKDILALKAQIEEEEKALGIQE